MRIGNFTADFGGLCRTGYRLSAGLMASVLISAPGLALAQSFKKAPGSADAKGGSGAEDGMILGLIHQNTLFFIVLGVFAVFWFLFGGGRKAKVGRKGP